MLARLALAEDAAAQAASRDATLDRFRDTERRYQAFRLKSLDPDLRPKFPRSPPWLSTRLVDKACRTA